MPVTHNCKCHDQPYTRCKWCQHEYCRQSWQHCPRCDEIAAKLSADASARRDAREATRDSITGHLPQVPWVEVDKETAYGSTVRLSRSIRVF